MAESLKVLAQLFPTAATLTKLYDSPNVSGTVSVLRASNKGAATTIRVSVRIGGAADNDKQYICYDYPLAANDAIDVIRGLTFAAFDQIWVYATLATVAFTAYGVEVS